MVSATPWLAAAALAMAAPSAADDPERPRKPALDRPNTILAGAVVEVPNPGVVVAYERLVHRAFGVRLDLEHLVSPPGFTHLPGLSSSVAVTAWPLDPGKGPYLLAGAGVGTNFWARRPQLARITGLVDVAAGYRITFPVGLVLGASAGLRYGYEARKEQHVCTHRDVCRNARTGPMARLVLEVGWRFGRRSQPS